MSQVRIGDLAVDVYIDEVAAPSLAGFVGRITDGPLDPAPGYHMSVAAGNPARLAIDLDNKSMSLAVALDRTELDQATTEIGLLQALARSVAFIAATHRHADTSTVLLHGSAFAIFPDHAIAVLDGGLGQGKTSLTMGLAARYGRLMVDEFAFAAVAEPNITVLAAPQWPWHVRSDMAQHLLPRETRTRLLFEPDLDDIAGTAADAAPLRMIFIPDRSLAAGQTMDVPPTAARHLLHSAVTDHARKLVDPGLDHVSIFDSPDQITTADGRPLHTQSATPTCDIQRTLDSLVTVPVFRVGIGGPADLPVSVAAAGQRLAELPACHQD